MDVVGFAESVCIPRGSQSWHVDYCVLYSTITYRWRWNDSTASNRRGIRVGNEYRCGRKNVTTMVRHEVATVLSAGPSPDAKGVVRKWRCSLETITHFKREKKARFIGWEKRSEQGVVPFARHVTIYEVGLGRKNTERKRKARDSEVGQTTGPWTRHCAERKEVGPWGAVYPGDGESLERKEAMGNSYIPRRPHYYYFIITINCIYFIYLPTYLLYMYLPYCAR